MQQQSGDQQSGKQQKQQQQHEHEHRHERQRERLRQHGQQQKGDVQKHRMCQQLDEDGGFPLAFCWNSSWSQRFGFGFEIRLQDSGSGFKTGAARSFLILSRCFVGFAIAGQILGEG